MQRIRLAIRSRHMHFGSQAPQGAEAIKHNSIRVGETVLELHYLAFLEYTPIVGVDDVQHVLASLGRRLLASRPEAGAVSVMPG